MGGVSFSEQASINSPGIFSVPGQTLSMLRTLARQCIRITPWVRHKSTVPFDTKPFPFSRFEPCCPEQDSPSFSNGFVPCKQHPIPHVLGGRFILKTTCDSPRFQTLRCLCRRLPRWTRAKVEAVQGGIVNTISKLDKDYSLLSSPAPTKDAERQLLTTVCDRPSETPWPTSDVMVFPEFQALHWS